jgi:hypothetical protein
MIMAFGLGGNIITPSMTKGTEFSKVSNRAVSEFVDRK